MRTSGTAIFRRAAAVRAASEANRREEALYLQHRDDVFRYVAVLTGDPDVAADIVAETFARALVAGRAGKLPEPAVPWLLVTSRRLATDRWRRIKTARLARPALKPGEPRHIDDAESRLWLAQICGLLNPRQREAIVLRYVSDLADREIGRAMNLSESGVRSLISRALERLRTHPEVWR
jgi:RNA polymerase sigma-70 factor (ECF subfamily)